MGMVVHGVMVKVSCIYEELHVVLGPSMGGPDPNSSGRSTGPESESLGYSPNIIGHPHFFGRRMSQVR